MKIDNHHYRTGEGIIDEAEILAILDYKEQAPAGGYVNATTLVFNTDLKVFWFATPDNVELQQKVSKLILSE